MDDVLALLALGIAGQLSSGAIDIFSVVLFFVKSILFIVVGTYLGRRPLTHIMNHVDSSYISEKYPDFIFIMAMMFAFLYAMIAEPYWVIGNCWSFSCWNIIEAC